MPSDAIPSSDAKDIPGCSTAEARIRTESESSDKAPRFILPGTPNSPPRILTLDEVQDMVKNIKNMALAHEIAVNTDFKLEAYEPPENSVEKIIKETMHKAFWDILRKQLESTPPVYTHALVLLTDIKEAFQSIFLENNKKALDRVNEVLDSDLIKQQAEQGVLDFKTYSNFIVHVMSLACAPIRDEAVAKLKECDDIVDLFRGILETLELMKLDMANCLLNAARSEVIANSVSYEKQKFKEYLEYYKDGFPATEAWLKRNLPVESEASSASTGNADKKVKDLIFNAYMELLDWKSENVFPEFFSMDHDRLKALQGKAIRVCACASALAIASGMPVISQSAEVKKSLAKEIEILLQNVKSDKDLEDALENVWLQIRSVVDKRLQEANQKSLDEETIKTLKSHVLNIAKIDESPVRKLMWKRLFTYIQLVLRSNAAIPPPPGFGDSDELENLGQAFRRVTYYNYAVYNEYYSEIVNKLQAN